MADKKRNVPTGAPAELKHNPFARALGTPPAGAAPAPAPAAGEPQPAARGPALDGKLVVRRELKGRGGKTVTRIRGLHARDLPSLATTLKKKLGCGAVIEDGDLLLLGDLVDRAAEWLASQGATRVVKGN